MSNEFDGKYSIIYLSKGEKLTYKGYELVIYNNGDKHYLLDGKYDRDDGPTVIYPNGDKSWYLNDEKYIEEEYCIIQKFCSHCNTKLNTLYDLMEHYKKEQIKYPEFNNKFQEKIDSIYLQFLK